MSASIHTRSMYACSLTVSLSHAHTQICDPCFYHGAHTFAYSHDGTMNKSVTIDSMTEKTVGRNDMAWGLMDEMVCTYGTCLHECMNTMIYVFAVPASVHARSIHVCAFTNTRTHAFSRPLCVSLALAHSLSVSHTRSRARAHARSSHERARTHTRRPSHRF